ncbi:FxDxF family PEP-CTERM protein [Sphingomonas sp. JC676]|uniref:FxDxF family PEP-CTERM protein n=1 Tax=Sphingomonas sp. JC676 TaxID=2768065 RepID=UPI0016584D20|nr:FxDxF family PEP-CTERM protein [Sphingomonas sp. JC676]MBC9032814.1 FxDxF family PEP-CTERM protein [Sphingomonas sp. JC676]
MTRFQRILTAAAVTAAAFGFTGSASAANFICNPAPGVCTFDGTTGGIVNSIAKGSTHTDRFYFTVSSAGEFLFNWTTSKLSLTSANFNGGAAFAPVFGQDYSFNVLAAGTYFLEVTSHNSTERTSTFVTSADFAAVPEPAMWGMMIGGFGLGGMAMRRRRALGTATFA